MALVQLIALSRRIQGLAGGLAGGGGPKEVGHSITGQDVIVQIDILLLLTPLPEPPLLQLAGVPAGVDNAILEPLMLFWKLFVVVNF